MKLVIDIPEDVYKEIYYDAEIIIYSGMRNGKTLFSTLLRAVRKGTPLPKGHGRLIDADAINTKWSDPEVSETLDEAPTIIEADKEN